VLEELQLPEVYQKDIQKAVEILKDEGCTEVYLFGSLVHGKIRDKSDIDLAVRGCPDKKFFHVLGKLLLKLDHSVDLIDLDSQDAFARFLEEKGRLVQIG